MKQLLLSLCLSLAAISGSAQNAAAIEQKLIEYGRMFTTKQNIYYFIGDDGKVFIGELKTYQEAENLPIKKVWCVCKAQSSFEKYKRKGCRLFFVDNREENDMCYTLMIAYPNGELDFWDMEDIKIEDNHIDGYLETFTEEAKNFLSTISQNMKNESKNKTKTNESFSNSSHVFTFDEFIEKCSNR